MSIITLYQLTKTRGAHQHHPPTLPLGNHQLIFTIRPRGKSLHTRFLVHRTQATTHVFLPDYVYHSYHTAAFKKKKKRPHTAVKKKKKPTKSKHTQLYCSATSLAAFISKLLHCLAVICFQQGENISLCKHFTFTLASHTPNFMADKSKLVLIYYMHTTLKRRQTSGKHYMHPCKHACAHTHTQI